MEADAIDLATGPVWHGEGPFPVGRFTRVLLLQQMLVEVMDLLDPDCVRLPMERRQRLMPINWGKLPRVAEYQQQLKDLSSASATNFANGGKQASSLEGLRDLVKSPFVDEAPLTSSFRSSGEQNNKTKCDPRKIFFYLTLSMTFFAPSSFCLPSNPK